MEFTSHILWEAFRWHVQEGQIPRNIWEMRDSPYLLVPWEALRWQILRDRELLEVSLEEALREGYLRIRWRVRPAGNGRNVWWSIRSRVYAENGGPILVWPIMPVLRDCFPEEKTMLALDRFWRKVYTPPFWMRPPVNIREWEELKEKYPYPFALLRNPYTGGNAEISADPEPGTWMPELWGQDPRDVGNTLQGVRIHFPGLTVDSYRSPVWVCGRTGERAKYRITGLAVLGCVRLRAVGPDGVKEVRHGRFCRSEEWARKNLYPRGFQRPSQEGAKPPKPALNTAPSG